MHLHKKMVNAKKIGRFVFVNPTFVSKARMGKRARKIGQGLLLID